MSKEELLKYLIAEIDLIMHDKDYRFENANGTWYSRESCRDLTNEEVFEELRTELRQFADLETKLAESEKKAYSRGHSQRDIANEIKLNALREDVANKEKRIVELKQQLAESEKKNFELVAQINLKEHKPAFCTLADRDCEALGQVAELKQQLAESEKSKESYRLQNEQHHLQLLQFYSRLGVEAFGADIHEKALETLMIMKEQLVEKEKELAEYADINNTLNSGLQEKCILCEEEHNKDKISFAVEQLEKVKELLNTDFESIISWIDPYEDGECLTSMTYNHNNTIKIIDNQIKKLRGRENE